MMGQSGNREQHEKGTLGRGEEEEEASTDGKGKVGQRQGHGRSDEGEHGTALLQQQQQRNLHNSRPQMTTIINTSNVMEKTDKCGLRTYIPAEVDTDVHHHQPGLAYALRKRHDEQWCEGMKPLTRSGLAYRCSRPAAWA